MGTITTFRLPRGGESKQRSGVGGQCVIQQGAARSTMSESQTVEVRNDRVVTLKGFRNVKRLTTMRRGKGQPAASPSYGRAAVAYQEEFAKWQGLIDAIATHPGLSPDQRASGVAALRWRQQAEANGARRRVLDEEKQSEKAARQARHRLTQPVVVAKCG
jgi:hypothetical protein